MSDYVIMVIYFAIGIVGIKLSIKNAESLSWYLLMYGRVAIFLPIYALGILYKEKMESKDKINNLQYFSLCLGFELIVIILGGYNFIPCWAKYNSSLLHYANEILGIAFFLRVSKIIRPIIDKKSKIYTIADNTYSIMMNHFLGFIFAKSLFLGIKQITNGYLCKNFNLNKFFTDIWYYYTPNGKYPGLITYLFFGILFSIFIGKIMRFLQNSFINMKRKSQKQLIFDKR